MTPTELASALRDVEIANEEENLAKFQSDAAIVEDAAGIIDALGDPNTVYANILRGTIAMSRANAIAFIGNAMYECKDLEWLWDMATTSSVSSQAVKGVTGYYFLYDLIKEDGVYSVHYQTHYLGYTCRVDVGTFDSLSSAQAAANDHNKQQFQNIIEEWRKG